MSLVDEKFLHYKSIVGDIEEHMDTLLSYALQSDSILELGTRKLVSTFAFLKSRPLKLTCVDIVHPSEYGSEGMQNLVDAENISAVEGIEFKFIHGNDLELSLLDYDLIFIDTEHTYDQLKKELKIYGNKAKKFLIFHDTNVESMTVAIYEFLKENKSWSILEKKDNCNGLMVLGKTK